MNYSLQRNICRTCLTEGSSVKSIFSFEQIMGQEIQLCDMLMALASLVVVYGDGLPENVCFNCSQQTVAAYSFKKLCESSDTTLREQFRDSNGIIMLNSIKKEESEFYDGVASMSLGQVQVNEYKEDRGGIENVKTEINEFMDKKPIFLDNDLDVSDIFIDKSKEKTHNFLHNNLGINDTIVEPTNHNFSLATFHKEETYNNTLNQLEERQHKETIEGNDEFIDKRHIFSDNDILCLNDSVKDNFSLAAFNKPMEETYDITLRHLEESRHKETIDENAEEAESSIPRKSEDVYKREFDRFFQWMRDKNMEIGEIVTEKVLLAYFSDQSKKYKSSSLWCTYSKLKCMLRIKNNIDIGTFSKLIAFLKNRSVGYSPEKSPVFTQEQLMHFLLHAPDDKYLLMKVVTIFGLFGACRRMEFYNLCVGDVKEEGTIFVVHVRKSKTQRPRTFTILNSYDSEVNYIDIIKRYMSVRPKHVKNDKFFLFYNAGKCTCNPIGINTFGRIPRNIAKYLKIPNAVQYTGLSFRRTSATILADSGADIRTIKCHGDWKSDAAAEGYVADSRENKNKISETLRSASDVERVNNQICISASTSTGPCVLENSPGISVSGNSNTTAPSVLETSSEISISGNSNCEITEGATSAMDNIKSKKMYEKLYKQFMDWRDTNNIVSFSENDVLLYFEELASRMKSSSVWTHYSIIKSLLNMKHNVDISKYTKLNGLLKRKSEGYTGKKSKTFSPQEINRFLDEAPDDQFLLTKVAMIFGIVGGCRRHELHDLLFKNVHYTKEMLIVNIAATKTKTQRTFTVTGKYYAICKKYINLRPEVCHNPFFFVNYMNGKCTVQKIGINKFGNLGKHIATYLKLPDANLYTGHCFRRTSATVLVDSGGDITTLKRRSCWKSTTEGYIENTG